MTPIVMFFAVSCRCNGINHGLWRCSMPALLGLRRLRRADELDGFDDELQTCRVLIVIQQIAAPGWAREGCNAAVALSTPNAETGELSSIE